MNMFYQEKNNTMEALFATIGEKGFQGMGEAIQILMNEAMKIERNRFLGVLPYERNPDREGYANGYKGPCGRRPKNVDLDFRVVVEHQFARFLPLNIYIMLF